MLGNESHTCELRTRYRAPVTYLASLQGLPAAPRVQRAMQGWESALDSLQCDDAATRLRCLHQLQACLTCSCAHARSAGSHSAATATLLSACTGLLGGARSAAAAGRRARRGAVHRTQQLTSPGTALRQLAPELLCTSGTTSEALCILRRWLSAGCGALQPAPGWGPPHLAI